MMKRCTVTVNGEPRARVDFECGEGDALVATIEEHSLIGGFGSAVAEWVVDTATIPTAFIRFGTPDAFFKMSGEQEFAREQLGLSGHEIADRIRQTLARNQGRNR